MGASRSLPEASSYFFLLRTSFLFPPTLGGLMAQTGPRQTGRRGASAAQRLRSFFQTLSAGHSGFIGGAAILTRALGWVDMGSPCGIMDPNQGMRSDCSAIRLGKSSPFTLSFTASGSTWCPQHLRIPVPVRRTITGAAMLCCGSRSLPVCLTSWLPVSPRS